jgi:hypothetical protein
MTIALEDRELVEATAQRVVERLREQGMTAERWLSAREVAGLLSLDVEVVRRHAAEWGARRVAGRLRYPLSLVAAPTPPEPAQAPSPVARRRRRHAEGDVDLLPIRERV